MRSSRLLASAVALICLCGEAFALDKVLIGNTGSASSLQWPSHIAIMKGFYQDAGIDVELVPMPSSAAGLQQLTTGATNMNSSGVVDAVRAIDKGAPIRFLRMEGRTSPYEVYALSSIKQFADLKKKTVMIGGIKDITRIYFEELSIANGLKPGDFDYMFAGATASRYAALSTGSIAATIITPPFNFQAESAGFNRLGASTEVQSKYPFSLYSVNINWAKQNPRAIKGFLGAYARGVDYFYDRANAAEVQSIFEKISRTNPEDVRKTYEFYQKIRLCDREGSIDVGGMQDVIELMKADGEIEGATEMSRFFDPAFVQK